MSIISSIFTYCETAEIKFHFLSWIVTLFVPKNKRWALAKFITYYPYYYLTKRRAKPLNGSIEGLCVNGIVSISGNTYLGEHCNFNGMIIQGAGKVSIGRYFHSGENCRIITQNHNYEGGKIPYDETLVIKDVTIGDFVWMGTGVTILPGAQIGEGAVIQAGSVVSGKIPDYAIAGGAPAKVFKYRDIEHFKKLKAENKFL